jgi:hypothetical protein
MGRYVLAGSVLICQMRNPRMRRWKGVTRCQQRDLYGTSSSSKKQVHDLSMMSEETVRKRKAQVADSEGISDSVETPTLAGTGLGLVPVMSSRTPLDLFLGQFSSTTGGDAEARKKYQRKRPFSRFLVPFFVLSRRFVPIQKAVPICAASASCRRPWPARGALSILSRNTSPRSHPCCLVKSCPLSKKSRMYAERTKVLNRYMKK